MYWPQPGRTPNAHQHPDRSHLHHQPTIFHPAHQPPAALNLSTSTRTMNSPLPFSKPPSYPRPTYETMLCSHRTLSSHSHRRFAVSPSLGLQEIHSHRALSQPRRIIHHQRLFPHLPVVLPARTLRSISSHGQRSTQRPAATLHSIKHQIRIRTTFKRHFIAILADTHPSFPINFWHELIPQAEITLKMLRAFADQSNISTYHGIHRKPYDFLSHPLAPCGTLIVLHNSIRETWDNFGHIGFYLGPASSHYRSYRCLVQETNSIRISDSIMQFPAPLVEPGASRFNQLLALTEKLLAAAETTTTDDSRAQLH